MFVGEAPGFSEDSKGRPFVGAAGRFLESLLSEIGYSRKEVFICNVLRCRPPGNSPPRRGEIQTCTPYLDRQISIIEPKFVVALGNCATMYIFSKANLPFSGITRSRGKFHQAAINGMQVTIFATFHPAAALYSLKFKEQIIDDFRLLGQGANNIQS